MAERFVRVDLSDAARDFRPVAVEPGVPLLDRSQANSKILFRWLGGLVAEPEWEGESVNFFVRDDHGGRLEEVACQPASDDDLKGPLKADMEALAERIAAAKPENSTERAVHKILRETFAALTEDENRTDRDNYFFKYRDVLSRWRLVWCWGYQRVDVEPAATVICTDPQCCLLFVRRPGQTPRCPSCEAALLTGQKKRRPSRTRALFVGLLLFLLGCLLMYWFLGRNRLVASPKSWNGRVGSRIEFQVNKRGLLGGTDVSQQAVAVADDPRVIRFDHFGSAATARSPGRTLVRFYLGDQATTATVTVAAAENPKKITIDPELVELGIGTTAHLKLTGEYEDGSTGDLTEAAEWEAKNDGVVFAHEGFLEGLAEGTSTIRARYRAGPADEYLEASANVSVVKVDFTALDMALDPDPVPVGRGSKLQVDAVSRSGKKYCVLESSRLQLAVDPAYLATVRGRHVEGNHPGHGTLQADFDGQLSGNLEFDVALGPGIDSLVVAPERLDMVVGEIADLSIASPSREPIRITSSDSKVVQITRDSRLVARSEGSAQIEVSQGGESRTVEVVVTKANVESIAIQPPRVVVPVDHSQAVCVTGRVEGERDVELAPDLLTCEKRPSPRYADFDAGSMEVLGISPTQQSSPQSLALRFLDKELLAEAPVEVVTAPLRLELTPSGHVDLPLGQAMAVDAWANYRGGHRVQVFGDRVDWHSDPPSGATPGLELRDGEVAALEAGAGPLAVWGTYLGQDSNRVTFNSVEAGPVDLALEVDRTLRLANEPGRVILSGTGPTGDVELVPELATFESSDSDVVNVDAATGAFRAGKPGEATITAKHAASSKPASVTLTVVDPASARLAFEPRSVKVAVDEVARLALFLEAKVGDEVRRAAMVGPGVAYSIERPEAVRWQAPLLVGLSPAAEFEMTASYLPYLLRPAVAKIEVLAAEEPAAIRVVPSETTLAAGQMLPLVVEEQLPGSQEWKEVRADAVAWQVPPRLIWAPATESLRPAVTVAPGTKGRFELKAKYRGKEATCKITTTEPGLDPADPGVELVLQREPEGQYLPVGKQQRYSIILRKDGQQEPASEIHWPRYFENEYVRWKAPVLTAKQAGYEQRLRAEVGGRRVLWRTNTIDPFQPGQLPPRREDQPVEVVILSDQGPAVEFPVGARFEDFRIEARYADGFTRMATKKAFMSTDAGFLDAPVSFSEGRMIGVRPGKTLVHAQFDGVATEKGLQVTVTEDVDPDKIRLKPAPLEMLPGETVAMDAEGFKNEKSIGVITGIPGLAWSSDDEEVVRTNGPAVTGLKLGRANVTARFGLVTSEPAGVSVVDSIGEALVVDQDVIQMRVGESRRIGTDLVVRRGGTDFSRQCDVTPALPNVVRYVPETHSLVGVSPGVSAVTFAWGDKLASTTVQVLPSGALEGALVVEPATAILSPGQAVDMRVFLHTPAGLRIDRTNSAVLASSRLASVTIRGTRACAVASGVAEITATLPEVVDLKKAGRATVTVNNEPIDALLVEPSQLALSVGDSARLRILGTSSSGTHELFPQADLQVAAEGENPEAIRIVGSEQVDAVAPGSADVAVRWQNRQRGDRLSQNVPVAVTSDPLTGLTIDPVRATIHPGQGLVYQVTGMRGGRRRVLRPEDGVQLFVGQGDVAEAAGGMLVVGKGTGRTDVVAQAGSERAEAVLSVVPGTGPATGSVVVGGAPGYGHIGTDYIIRDGRRYVYRDGVGYVVVDGDGVVVGGTPGVIDVPPALGVDSLRFVPDVVRMGTDSPGAHVRVFEVLADGTLSRDLTADPALEFNTPGNVARVERTAEGPIIRPVAPGETRVAARLGTGLFAEPELLVQVGDVPTGLARLDVSPDPLDLWSGEARRFTRVTVTPAPGQFPIDVRYSVTVPPGQAIVTAEPDGSIRGLSPGLAQVVIRVVEPGTAYDELSMTATVQVTSPDHLWIEPPEVSLKVGETTPQFAVMAQGVDGRQYQVPAALDSMDTSILRGEGLLPGQFLAASLGSTQVRAVYRSREMFATVTVTGERFLDVKTTLNEGDEDFFVTIEVLAAKSEGPLEYRTYVAGQTPPDVWQPAEEQGEYRRVVLRSPRMAYGARSARYGLIVEARSPGSGAAERYPFTFRLAPRIERTDQGR